MSGYEASRETAQIDGDSALFKLGTAEADQPAQRSNEGTSTECKRLRAFNDFRHRTTTAWEL